MYKNILLTIITVSTCGCFVCQYLQLRALSSLPKESAELKSFVSAQVDSCKSDLRRAHDDIRSEAKDLNSKIGCVVDVFEELKRVFVPKPRKSSDEQSSVTLEAAVR